MKNKYQKPNIKTVKVKMNTFWQNRSFDSINLLNMNTKSLFAAGGTSASSGSCYVCFIAGTKVLMNDKSLKRIETIQKEDLILSFNPESKVFVQNAVSELIVHENSDSDYLIVNNRLNVTLEHIMFINNEWQPARNLKLQDVLINDKGEKEIVVTLENGEKKTQNMYNLELSGNEHNFFAEGILVHNAKSGPCLSDSTKIETPSGKVNVTKIKKGQLIWTINYEGKKVAAPVLMVSKTAVSKTHQVCHLVLKDGRELFVSLYHPTVLGGTLANLKVGQNYDGSIISRLDLITYGKEHTYDLLPDGGTGFYWANGILMGSTLIYKLKKINNHLFNKAATV